MWGCSQWTASAHICLIRCPSGWGWSAGHGWWHRQHSWLEGGGELSNDVHVHVSSWHRKRNADNKRSDGKDLEEVLNPYTRLWCGRKSRFRHIFHHHSGRVCCLEWNIHSPGNDEEQERPWAHPERCLWGIQAAGKLTGGKTKSDTTESSWKRKEHNNDSRLSGVSLSFQTAGITAETTWRIKKKRLWLFVCVILYYSKTLAIAVLLINPGRNKTWTHGVLLLQTPERKCKQNYKTIRLEINHVRSNLELPYTIINHNETKNPLFCWGFFLTMKQIQHWLIRYNICGCGLFLNCETICNLRNAESEREHSTVE